MRFTAILLIFAVGAIAIPNSNAAAGKINITALEMQPFLYMDKGHYTGFLHELLEYLREKLNFKYEINWVGDKKFGTKLDNGSWTGMIGAVTSGKADMILAPLTVSMEREKVVDFTKPFMTMQMAAMFQKPEPGHRVFHNMKELANSDYKYVTLPGGATEAFFRESNYNLFSQMGKHMKEYASEMPNTLEHAVELVRDDPNLVFIGESVMIEHWIHSQPCDLAMQMLGNHRSYAMAFKKGSHYVRDFSAKLLEMQEDGSMHLLRDKYWVKECRAMPKLCVCDHKSSEDSGEDETDEM